jgi:hypothetical protein
MPSGKMERETCFLRGWEDGDAIWVRAGAIACDMISNFVDAEIEGQSEVISMSAVREREL